MQVPWWITALRRYVLNTPESVPVTMERFGYCTRKHEPVEG